MRPGRAQPVVLRLPGREELRAYVTGADEQRVTLVLALREQRLEAADGTPAVVEYTSASGVHRLTGRMGSGPAGVVHLDRQQPADEVADEHIQRREWARAETSVPVELEFRDLTTGRHATVAVNISGGGALLHDPVGLPLGAQLMLRLQLESSIILAEAEVVRETDSGDKGVRITAISEADREAIVRFVALCQREQLARRKELSR